MAKKPPKLGYAERQALYKQRAADEAQRIADRRALRRHQQTSLHTHRASFAEQLKFYDEFIKLQAEGKLPSLDEVKEDAKRHRALSLFKQGMAINHGTPVDPTNIEDNGHNVAFRTGPHTRTIALDETQPVEMLRSQISG